MASQERQMALVTIGTDGFVDYVQVPDGQKFMLGPVSVLRLITGVTKTARSARVALDEFLATGKTMLSVDIDRMWELLPFRRARYSSFDPFVPSENSMTTASYDSLIAHVELAENIVSKVADTDETIDQLVAQGKRFNAAQAKADLLRIASRVADITQNVDLAQAWVGADLSELSAQANEIHALFPARVAASGESAKAGDAVVLSKDVYGHAHEGFRKNERVRVVRRYSQSGNVMLELRSGKGVVVTVYADDIEGEIK